MDDSFGQWREGNKPSSKSTNGRTSLVLSESEDEPSLSYTGNRRNNVVIEASDSDDDTDMFASSRTSGRWGKSNQSIDDVTASDVTADPDDSDSSVDGSQVRKRHPKRLIIPDDSDADETRHLQEEDSRSLTNSEASDADGSSENTDHSNDEDASDLDTRRKSRSRSNSEDNAVGEPMIQKEYKADMSFGLDVPLVRKKRPIKQMIFDDHSEAGATPQSERQSIQTKDNSVILDESYESSDQSHLKDNATGLDENSASTSHSNFNENRSSVGQRIEVDRSAGWSEQQDDKYVTISDSSDSDDKPVRTNPNNRLGVASGMSAGQSLASTTNSEADAVILSLAEKEVGVGNIDPFIEQKRAILTCNIEQVQSRIAKSKMILNTANVALLPDKGEKLRRSIDIHEAELRKLSEQLESLPKLRTPKPQVKKEPVKNPIVPPPWKGLPEPMPVKELGQKALATHEKEQALTIERLEDLHGSLNARPSEDERAKDPKGLKVSLMPHQQHALAWLVWREKQRPHGGILADDMGLGKTLTMISLILTTMADRDSDDENEDSDNEWVHHKKNIRPNGGTLVVCPASLLSQWEGEIKRRVKRGLLSVEIFHGNRREAVPRRLAKIDVVITTYNLISREYKGDSVLYNIRWKRVILDEAHIVRNHKSQASEAVCNLYARNRWALTGTPIQNKELDLYALLKFLKCSPFDDLRVWKRWVDNKNAHGHERLATLMKTLMLRRTKVGLQALGGLGALPDKSLEEIHIKLDSEEQLVYEKVLVFSRTLFAQFLHQRAEKNHMFEVNAGNFNAPTFLQRPKDTQFTKVQNQLLARHADVKAHEILVLLLRLRQVCCHPALIHAMLDQEDLKGNDIVDEGGVDLDVTAGLGALNLEGNENIDPNEIGVNQRVVENLLTKTNPVFNPARQSSKMRAVLNTIQTILDKGDKIVVVSQWTSMLEVVRSHLKSLKGATYDILSGNVPVKHRQQIVESFNKVDSSPRILLLSLTAGGVGLNLVGGNHLLLLDIHWNPQLEAQAQDRIYRVGQTKSVYIYKFMCLDTVEQRIKALQDNKLAIAQGVLTGAGPASAAKLTLDDLKSLFSL